MTDKRITVFAGLAGSGKTSIAVNYALYLRKTMPCYAVTIADLDIVNPYFRANNSRKQLTDNNIDVISSPLANSNLDAPASPQAVKSVFDNKNIRAVIDLGGDEAGAAAIGRYKAFLDSERDKNILLVVNCFRPFTKTPLDIAKIKTETENAARFKYTGIVNNSNLAALTKPQDIISSAAIITEAADKLNLPVVMTTADIRFKNEIDLLNIFYINPFKNILA